MKKISIWLVVLLFFIFYFIASAMTPVLQQNAERYIGTKYELGALGEGIGAPYYSLPFRRTDAFDCVTFVETVLADYSGTDLQKVRYAGGQIDFFARNHFIESDWIPNAYLLGLIEPVETAGAKMTFATVDLSKWYQSKIKNPLPKDVDKIKNAKPFNMSIPYVPRAKITSELLGALPADAIAFFVKCNVNANGIRGDMVAHLGFLFNGQTMIHAGQAHGVQKINFIEYMTAHPQFCGVGFYKVTNAK